MSSRRYQYARLWVPLYDAASLAVSQPVYLIEAADGFEGFVAEKNTTLVALFNELGHRGWKISPAATRVSNPSPELQLLVDATLDEADHSTGSWGSGGLPSELLASAHPVDEYDVYGMRRRA